VDGEERGDVFRDEKGERGSDQLNHEVGLVLLAVGVGGHVSDSVELEVELDRLPDELGLLSLSRRMVRNAEGNMLGWLFAGTSLLGLAGLELLGTEAVTGSVVGVDCARVWPW